MDRATAAWSRSFGEPRPGWTEPFARRLRKSHVVYGCMVLLPSGAYDELDRQGIDLNVHDTALQHLYKLIAHHLKITHIAFTRPIPPQDDHHGGENIIRAPTNFTPLFGNFGPTTCHDPPSAEDFQAAFWVTAKQNGIYQVWAPRWTMFSRGNISEKARVLSLPSVASAVEDGRTDGRGCAAVDLYAGIGYFTFSYLKAGVSRVLCWDLNPWSIEGLVRGAVANKWSASLVDNRGEMALGDAVGLVAFNEDNTAAGAWVGQKRLALPPVRHVNCGLLPTSRSSWPTAIDVLDEALGGWIHVHENFAVGEINAKAEEARCEIQRLVEQQRCCSTTGHTTHVELQNINRLKSYAPGVFHCVLDIYVPPYVH